MGSWDGIRQFQILTCDIFKLTAIFTLHNVCTLHLILHRDQTDPGKPGKCRVLKIFRESQGIFFQIVDYSGKLWEFYFSDSL